MKSTILALMCVLTCVLAGVASAQSETPQAATSMPQSTMGTVVSSDSKTLVVRTDEGQQMTFQVDTYTVLPTHLMAGEKIKVLYNRGSDNLNNATLVSLQSTTPAANPDMGAEETSPTSQPPPASSGAAGSSGSMSTSAPRAATAPSANGTHEMPSTASPLWLLALVGVAATGSAVGMRLIRR